MKTIISVFRKNYEIVETNEKDTWAHRRLNWDRLLIRTTTAFGVWVLIGLVKLCIPFDGLNFRF